MSRWALPTSFGVSEASNEDARMGEVSVLERIAAPLLATNRDVVLAGDLNALARHDPYPADLAARFIRAEIDKYGQRFSALQFLLSSDRQHYAALPVIWLLYSALHVLVIAALAFIQWPTFRSSRTARAAPTHGTD